MHYVTREHIHVDRIATAWAIRRFVDPNATFAFVRRTKDVDAIAGTAFDIRGAELSHRGTQCTFEVLLERYGLTDPALARLGLIIRGADMPTEDAAPPESSGVRAVFDGVRDADLSDEERLRIGSAFCDALFAFCSSR